jgi:ribosomal protein S18 acetylase RimI-like enzyme
MSALDLVDLLLRWSRMRLLQNLQECLSMARKERKVVCAGLHVDPQNEGARKLYQSLGFKIDGVLQDYYSPGRPAWKMLKDLG